MVVSPVPPFQDHLLHPIEVRVSSVGVDVGVGVDVRSAQPTSLLSHTHTHAFSLFDTAGALAKPAWAHPSPYMVGGDAWATFGRQMLDATAAAIRTL